MKNSYAGFSAVTALAAMTIACGSPEGQVIDNFFRAVQAKDSQTVDQLLDGPVRPGRQELEGQERGRGTAGPRPAAVPGRGPQSGRRGREPRTRRTQQPISTRTPSRSTR